MQNSVCSALAVTCGHPINLTDEPITVYGNLYPAIEGSNVTFSCPPRLVLTGPNMSTCMENGEWEPDIKEVKCLSD